MEEKTYIFEGKTTNEAIEKGLRELKTTKNKVEIKVLEEEDKKTFFSILTPKIVKVEMRWKEITKSNPKEAKEMGQVIQELEIFVNDFMAKLPIKDLAYTIKKE